MSSRNVRKKNKSVQLNVNNIERCSDWAAVLVAELYMCDWEGSAGGGRAKIYEMRHANRVADQLRINKPPRFLLARSSSRIDCKTSEASFCPLSLFFTDPLLNIGVTRLIPR
jgi:hypothetical protein